MKKRFLIIFMIVSVLMISFFVSAFADTVPLANEIKADTSKEQLLSCPNFICYGAKVNYYIENCKYKSVITIEGDTPLLIQNQELVKFLALCTCLLYTSPSPRDLSTSRMPSSA
eukprot:TRINITY_DN61542_c0_g2_i1.p1 TRINITY_DN61542_c0_g2~~TRINITY_DN61542_c0_g2_i1.p1  ORF type:complete len:123 (+),score=11.36 TRINITY_DN61542_c0_g2_i1:28-369(+)